MNDDMQLAPVPQQQREFTPQQVALIKRQIAQGATDDELDLFIEVCKGTGLNPFMKQIYAIKRGDKMTIQTGIDGYRLLAARTGELAGIDDAAYDTEDESHPGRASVTVWRFMQGQRVPFTATARWREYSAENSMWKKMPYLMLAKCAEALALRKAFPAELSGVYTAEEMSQADTPQPTRYVEQAPRQELSEPPVETPALNGRPYNPLQDKTLRKNLNDLGCRSVADVEEFVEAVKGIYGEVSARTCHQHVDHLARHAAEEYDLATADIGTRGV